MWHDEVLAEIYKYRQEYAKSFNYNLHAMVEDLEKNKLLVAEKSLLHQSNLPNKKNKSLVET
ncbi:hypothetical protein [Okeania sp.]|uniref:hypothetical protein n=1 Tax=Okeania sp. TaxID=3100323 RepID=UPI002B4B1FDE|nr:hypothetical protein [Okeania sp.]MEB3339700.1 hypothetical protein [Okeania sp.]